MSEWERIGAMWERDDGSFSLKLDMEKVLELNQVLEESYISAFENNYKEDDRQPDFNLCINLDNDEPSGRRRSSSRRSSSRKPSSKKSSPRSSGRKRRQTRKRR